MAKHFTFTGRFQLTGEMKKAYNDDGFCIVKNFFDSEELSQMMKTVSHPDGILKESFTTEEAGKKKLTRIVWTHPGSDVTGMVARAEKVVNTCEEFLGGEVYHYHTKMLLKNPHVGGATLWHQDYGLDILENNLKASDELIILLQNKAHKSEDTIRAHQETIDALQNKAQESEETVTALTQQLREQARAGSTYVRWGRTSCPGNGSELVYQGVAGGSWYQHPGAAAEYLCLPLEPEYRNYTEDTPQTYSGYVYGAEYQLDGRADRMKFFPDIDASPNLSQQNVPCAVCHVSRSTMIMIPAKRTCIDGWTREYEGLLVSGSQDQTSATEYICLDDQPEVTTSGGNNENGKLLYFVEGRCGNLPCPHYVNGRELSCVVCTK